MDNSDIEVFIVGEGVSGINQLLSLGWRIIGPVAFVPWEQGRRGTPDRRLQYLPYAPMGRKIAEGELIDHVRADAVAFTVAQQQTSQLREDELLGDVPPLVDEDEHEPAAYVETNEPAPPIRRRKPQTIAETAAASVRE